jgi:hypothetical protein
LAADDVDNTSDGEEAGSEDTANQFREDGKKLAFNVVAKKRETKKRARSEQNTNGKQ